MFFYRNPLKWVQDQKLVGDGQDTALGWNAVEYNEQDGILAVSFTKDATLGAYAGSVILYKETESGFEEVQRIYNSEDSEPAGDRFGYELEFNKNKNLLFVSAYRDDLNGTNSGTVFVYASGSSGYQRVQTLTASGDTDPASDYFGFRSMSTDESGEILAIGSAYDDVNGELRAGSIYIFQSSSLGYQQVQKLTASGDSNTDQDRFGMQIRMGRSGNTLVVSATNDENSLPTGSAWIGSVYVFQSGSSGYEQVQNITSSFQPTDPLNYADNPTGKNLLFGQDMLLSSDEQILFVGAPNEESHVIDQYGEGAVYVYQKDESGQYQEVNKIMSAEDPIVNRAKSFGQSVAQNSKFLFVGANGEIYDPSDPSYLDRSGCVYVYEKLNGGYVFKEKIFGDVNSLGIRGGFGMVTVAAEDKLIVKSQYGDGGGQDSGEIYVFKYTRDY